MELQLFDLGSLLLASSEEAGAASSGGGGEHGASFTGLFIYIGLVLAIVFTILTAAKKSFGEKVFKKWPAQAIEQVYVFVEKLCVGTIGSHGRKYVPFIMTLWMMIFVGNLMALFMATSPTADLSFNLGMALIAVGYVQWEGIRSNGVIGHVSHFAGPKLVDWKKPSTIPFIAITFLLFGIEMISEVMKNLSLSLRLFGNIDGGHRAAETLNSLMAQYYVPLGAFLMPVKLLTVVVQALIFCLLTCVYLSLVTSHGDSHEEAPAH